MFIMNDNRRVLSLSPFAVLPAFPAGMTAGQIQDIQQVCQTHLAKVIYLDTSPT